MSKKEILIIGAGVIGCSIAFHLARVGIKSQIIEKDSIGARASGKSWGIFPYPPRMLPMHGMPPSPDLMLSTTGGVKHYIEIYWNGYLRLPDIALELKERAGIDVKYGYSPNISVALDEYEEDLLKMSLQSTIAQGYYQDQWLEASDIRSIYPDIISRVRGGVLVYNRQIETYRFTLGLGQAAENMGAEIGNGDVIGFRKNGTKVTAAILASGREIEADIFVLAMGPWTVFATKWLGKERRVFLNRDQCLVLRMPRPTPPYVIRSWDGNQIVPKTDGTILLGHAGVPDPQPGYDVPQITTEIKEELINRSFEILPSLAEADLVDHRGDLEGYAPSPRFVEPMIGLLPEWDNVYIAFRFGTMGVMASLGVGERMAELIRNGGKILGQYKALMEYLSPAKQEA